MNKVQNAVQQDVEKQKWVVCSQKKLGAYKSEILPVIKTFEENIDEFKKALK